MGNLSIVPASAPVVALGVDVDPRTCLSRTHQPIRSQQVCALRDCVWNAPDDCHCRCGVWVRSRLRCSCSSVASLASRVAPWSLFGVVAALPREIINAAVMVGSDAQFDARLVASCSRLRKRVAEHLLMQAVGGGEMRCDGVRRGRPVYSLTSTGLLSIPDSREQSSHQNDSVVGDSGSAQVCSSTPAASLAPSAVASSAVLSELHGWGVYRDPSGAICFYSDDWPDWWFFAHASADWRLLMTANGRIQWRHPNLGWFWCPPISGVESDSAPSSSSSAILSASVGLRPPFNRLNPPPGEI